MIKAIQLVDIVKLKKIKIKKLPSEAKWTYGRQD